MSKEKNKNNDDFELCFKFYEKAIEGRNFHYQNYNTWAHYYAIFTGALFIAYYTITDNACQFLPAFISIVGLITSICWHLTVKGHYHWMLSWIKIVHAYEEELAKIARNKQQKEYRVYSVYLKSSENVYRENISTQKLTSIFTIFIEFAWSVFVFREVYYILQRLRPLCNIENNVLTIIIVILLYVIGTLLFSRKTDTNEMNGAIYKNA